MTEHHFSHPSKQNLISNDDEPRQSLPCNVEPIVQFLKQEGLDSLRETVKNVAHRFNGRLWGTKRTGNSEQANKESTQENTNIAVRPKNKTDEKRITDDKNTNRSFDEKISMINNTINLYRIRKDTAGILLIINEKEFYQEQHPDLVNYLPPRKLETRDGTDMDQAILERTFNSFGYRVHIENDLTHSEILNAVRNVVNECVSLDSLIVCILSHGYKGIVYGANSIPVKIDDVENVMISDRLISKPKILIVQACQGDQTQRAKEVR